MTEKKSLASLVLCYVLWGFQPLYWALNPRFDSLTLLACRIVMAAVVSVLILAAQRRLAELKALFHNWAVLKFLLSAAVFLLADWAVFLIAINSGRVLDASLGYYINPLLLFALGALFYRETCTPWQLVALGVAALGVFVSTAAFGSFPYLSLIIAVNWGGYAALKKNVQVGGVLSIAAETLILTPLALAFALLFRREAMQALAGGEALFLLGSGVVTALPMFLYSESVKRFPMILLCFAQYLSPTFNLVCGLLMGERFSPSQLVSFAFFAAAIALFSWGEFRRAGRKANAGV